MTELRECDIEDCPYRSPSRVRGKQSGCCGMVRSMLAFGCPVRRPVAFGYTARRPQNGEA